MSHTRIRGAGHVPNVIAVGATRSGTTALARHLARHPQVFIAAEKEIHFFDDNRGLGCYRGNLEGADEAAVSASLSFEDAIQAEWRSASRAATAAPGACIRTWTAALPGAAAQDLRGVSTRVAARGPLPGHDERPRLGAARDLELPRSRVRAASRGACAPIQQLSGVPVIRIRSASTKLPTPLRLVVGKLNTKRDQYPPLDPMLRARLERALESEYEGLEARLWRDLSVWGGERS
jgi:hypothetical protein